MMYISGEGLEADSAVAAESSLLDPPLDLKFLFIPQIMMSSSSAPRQSQPRCQPRLGPGSNLRDAITFPSYSECPHENDIDLPYYDCSFAMIKPARHWCFIGQVVDASYILRLNLVINDKEGKKVPIWFHTEDRGSRYMEGPVARPDTTSGNGMFQVYHGKLNILGSDTCNVIGQTFVLLYPQRHYFMDFSEGFRIEDYSTVQVLNFRTTII